MAGLLLDVHNLRRMQQSDPMVGLAGQGGHLLVAEGVKDATRHLQKLVGGDIVQILRKLYGSQCLAAIAWWCMEAIMLKAALAIEKPHRHHRAFRTWSS